MFKKQLAAVNILLSIAIAISLFNEGLALKCYTCESMLMESKKCWADPKEVELFECDTEVTLLAASSRSFDSAGAVTTPAKTKVSKCVKIVFNNIDNVLAVHRACASESINTCDAFRKNHFIKEISFCEECTGDGCNSSSTITLGFITFLVSISIVMLLAH